MRVGTLDEPDRLPPEVHVYKHWKQPWMILPPGAKAVEQFYDRGARWPWEDLERLRRVILARLEKLTIPGAGMNCGSSLGRTWNTDGLACHI